CTRTQFPLTIAYAITIYKSQGITLDKGVLNISKKDFTPALTYIAYSRFYNLDNILFDKLFN
ncbi:uncharacterized protein MYCFIDRAFT_107238, partial [Pseudocercospora fijiensis CIRAD86]